jgi:hypothetical protein
MSTTRASIVLRHIRGHQPASDVSELLERFTAGRDEGIRGVAAAARPDGLGHLPSGLANADDADDAFRRRSWCWRAGGLDQPASVWELAARSLNTARRHAAGGGRQRRPTARGQREVRIVKQFGRSRG